MYSQKLKTLKKISACKNIKFSYKKLRPQVAPVELQPQDHSPARHYESSGCFGYRHAVPRKTQGENVRKPERMAKDPKSFSRLPITMDEPIKRREIGGSTKNITEKNMWIYQAVAMSKLKKIFVDEFIPHASNSFPLDVFICLFEIHFEQNY